MEKLAINPNRLQWCMNTLAISLNDLSNSIHIAEQTLLQVMENKSVLSVNQLEKIADFFKRSLLFFLDPDDVLEQQLHNQKITLSKASTYLDNLKISDVRKLKIEND
ncbi:MAG: hypothetical protein HFP81_03180 [Methylococcales symbiont of Hymedesmia sp. n. MRB-2018]|nr:MAG: hypothetical protein HFP81_03180 [Methylococcales symbiont of Hymedesmia sp. n. MRB-2018]